MSEGSKFSGGPEFGGLRFFGGAKIVPIHGYSQTRSLTPVSPLQFILLKRASVLFSHLNDVQHQKLDQNHFSRILLTNSFFLTVYVRLPLKVEAGFRYLLFKSKIKT